MSPCTVDGERTGGSRASSALSHARRAAEGAHHGAGQRSFLRDGHHTIDLAIDASDDIGLASLKVRYTKVSGSGERFTFSEGEVPIQFTRANDRAWTARAQWKLDGLSLEAGDMLVYRAIAADHRPGATPSESDSFIAEILSPGGQAAPGFSLDPESERYAVSQQMVILKTERLAARKTSMATDAFAAESQDLAGEQRKVRAEFVFMMGGELADAPDPTGDINDLNEEAEAQGENDLLAGRCESGADRAAPCDSRDEPRVDGTHERGSRVALTNERAALKQLEQAFSRTRHSAVRSPSVNGSTSAPHEWRAHRRARDAASVVESRRGACEIIGSALADIVLSAHASTAATELRDRRGGSFLAADVLRIDPSSKTLQDASALSWRGPSDASRSGDSLSESRALRSLTVSATGVASARSGSDFARRAVRGVRYHRWTTPERSIERRAPRGLEVRHDRDAAVRMVLRDLAIAIALVAAVDPAITLESNRSPGR